MDDPDQKEEESGEAKPPKSERRVNYSLLKKATQTRVIIGVDGDYGGPYGTPPVPPRRQQ